MFQLCLWPSRAGRFLLVAALLTSSAFALSVRPPTFEELVAKSAAIVRARVVAVEARPHPLPDGSPSVRTYVTLAVADTLKGEPQPQRVMSALGGKVGLHAVSVPGLPEFSVGEEAYYFLGRNGRGLFPLLAVGHGRYRIKQDSATGRSHVWRDNHEPLTSPAQVAVPLTATAHPFALAQTPMTTEAFELAVRAELHRSISSKEVQP